MRYRQILLLLDGRGKVQNGRAYSFTESEWIGDARTDNREQAAWDAFNDGERGVFSIYSFGLGDRLSPLWREAGKITDTGVEWSK